MEEKEQFAPAEIVKDGKVTRRTFVKGAGWLTITSAIGASALGCAPSKQGAEEEPLAETGPVADPEEGFTYKSACCSVNCTSRCHLRARVKDDKIYTVTPGQMPGRDDYANCCLRSIGLGTRTHDESVRVMHPMKRTGERGSGEFEQITWEQAIDEIAERMEATKAQYGPKACGFYSFTGNLSKLSWEAPTRFAGTYGATAFDIEGIMGDHGATMGMTLCFGQGRGAHDTRDYLNSKMVVLWGRNVADTHTSEFRYLVKARENGAKIVVVDPRLCSTAAIADQWIPIKAQTDPALALGMMNVIISKDLHAKDWLVANSVAPFLVRESDGALLRDGEGEDAAWMVWDTAANQAVPNTTEGVTAALSGTFEVNGEACRTAFDHLCDEVSKYTLEYTSEITGLDPEVIEAFAMDYINAQPAGIRMGQGMQRVYNSHSPFRTVATLAAVAGYIGVEGGGASHAGGTASIRSTPGVTIPAFNYDEWADTGANEVNMVKSSTLYDQIITKDPNPIDFMWFANSNFINMSPDANKIINEVLPNISTIVTVDPYLNLDGEVLRLCAAGLQLLGEMGLPRSLALGVLPEPRGDAGWREQVRRRDHVASRGQGGPGRFVVEDRRGMGAQLRERGASGLGGLRFRQGRGRGHLGTSRRHLRLPDCLRRRRVQDAFHEVHVLQRRPGGIRGGSALLQAHAGGSEGPARREVPARVSAVPRPHERAHPAHRHSGAGGHSGRASAGDEPGGCQGPRYCRRRRGEYHKRSWRLQDEGVCHRGHRARYGGHPKRLDSRLHH